MFCANSTKIRDAQIVDEILLVGRSAKVFPKEINLWTGRLRKEDPFHQRRWVTSNLQRACIEQKGGGRVNSLSPWDGLHIIFCLRHQRSWFLGLWTIRHTPLALVSQDFRYGLNYTTGFPGSPAGRQWTVGILSLHNQVSQFQ